MKPLTIAFALVLGLSFTVAHAASLEQQFRSPPDSARPGVYWYFMDGNLDRESMTADLESMREAGIGNLIFLEVNVGVPRGPVDFMSERWKQLFVHAETEARRLGIEITLGSGPGWAGSGGPWVKPRQSMQHLVASSVEVRGPVKFHEVLPIPLPRKPTRYSQLTPKLVQSRAAFYREVAVLAFPTPVGEERVRDIDEKALYDRLPFSSAEGVKPYLPAPAKYPALPAEEVIDQKKVLDLTGRMHSDGFLDWDVPAGSWTILRFCSRNNGSNTRPAPLPGYGFECDKFDSAALDSHFENYIGKLIRKVGPRAEHAGWTMLHIDSWEMGAQNWTSSFRAQFQQRRGYDPQPFYPAYTGRIVGSLELTERFLWDLRRTGQELVLENHAGRLKELGRQHGFGLSIEPYDMNPTADLDLGAIADVPMCEFWSDGYGFDSSYSCIEATSIAHTMGRPIVAAEAFTAGFDEKWKQYPGSMNNQGDWAFCMGINRFVYHTFAHKPLGDAYRPGMSMGPYGVHWDRGQTWWPMVADYHRYISRCSHLLRQGTTISDILYLTPEGAPCVFRPPPSSLEGSGMLADKKGHGFDGCSPPMLMEKAQVRNGQIVFPGGTTYRLLVLPLVKTMTPELLATLETLVQQGATLIGSPPRKSPSLVNYPACDTAVRDLARKLWKGLETPANVTRRGYGKGQIYWGGECTVPSGEKGSSLYPSYDSTVAILREREVPNDFAATGPVRYTHRRTPKHDIYFTANKTDQPIQADCTFRVANGRPELWDPVHGETGRLLQTRCTESLTTVPMQFAAYQSFFVVFPREASSLPDKSHGEKAMGAAMSVESAEGRQANFPKLKPLVTLTGPWEVSFDPQRGGPEKASFASLKDWTQREESGIRYYSGIATYHKTFDLPTLEDVDSAVILDLGTVCDLARVRVNGQQLPVVWTAPWQVNIAHYVRARGNRLEIEVANRWPNRLIGDQYPADVGVRTVGWPSGLLADKEYKTGRYTFTVLPTYDKQSPLLPSGLLGPVRILQRVAKPRGLTLAE